jgi:thiosulfate reductase / polysulfide reductase chain A
MANAKVIFLLGCHFGENIHVSHVPNVPQGSGKRRQAGGGRSPVFGSAAKSHIWVPIRPGTDTAMLLAIMNYLIQNEKYNIDFVEQYGEGFEEMAEGIKSGPWKKRPRNATSRRPDQGGRRPAGRAYAPRRHSSGPFFLLARQRLPAGAGLACLTGILGAFGAKGSFVPAKNPKRINQCSWPKGDEDADSLRKYSMCIIILRRAHQRN